MAAKAKITEANFKVIKMLLGSGMKRKEIADSMGISTWSVNLICNTESYEAYREVIHNRNAKPKEEPKAPVQAEPQVQVVEHQYRDTVKIEAPQYVMNMLQRTNELLETISNKLAFVVEELTGKVGE